MTTTKMQGVQKDVEAVTALMRENVDKIVDRNEELYQLEKTADELRDSSQQFKEVNRKMKWRMCMKNVQCMLVLVLVLVVLVVAVVALMVLEPWNVKSASSLSNQETLSSNTTPGGNKT